MIISTLFQIGTISPPDTLSGFGDDPGQNIGQLLNIIMNILIVGGGLYALLNFIIAGYGFLSAGGDPKKIESAWSKIWQSIIGLLFIAGSFMLAAIIGQLIFGDYDAILNPQIQTQ